jgi:adenosylcobinamide-phosphate synthase
MTGLSLIAAAWTIEVVFGWSDWLHKRIRHPVVWLGILIAALDRTFNRAGNIGPVRYASGVVATVFVVSVAAGLAWLIGAILPESWWGFAIEALIASSLIASRSLYAHVAAVWQPLATGDLDSARYAVAQIVGRDPATLQEDGIVRASLESLAENASDGVIAPVFWGVIFGLPGIAAYKTINTLDSMIGHRSDRHAEFGGFAARVDDLVNLIPARMTGALIAVASLKPSAFQVMLRDAGKHRSPNAGWPEAAMAGGLGIRLSGPRFYAGQIHDEPWLNGTERDPEANDLNRGLALYCAAMGLGGAVLVALLLGVHYES